jgi:hypothetical protein
MTNPSESRTLEKRLTFIEDKVRILEDENVETTNMLYEIENRLQSRIDALTNYLAVSNKVFFEKDDKI